VSGSTGLRQAVILAGGRGERMRPLTDTVPKPLIPLHGRPFLDYLFEELERAGLERVLVLAGHLGAQVQAFVDGRGGRMRATCIVSPAEDETGQRLRRSVALLDDVFLLMYADNFWPLRLKDMEETFARTPALAQVTVYSNRDGYTRNNVRVEADGTVSRYDRSRANPSLNGVEIGFSLVRHELVERLPAGNVAFEPTVLPALAAGGQLHAYVTEHRYYTVGSMDRFSRTERFLARQPAVILDRDGVINRKPPKAQYVRSWDEFVWMPGAIEALAELKRAGFRLLLVSNQAGVGRGMMTPEALTAIHDMMQRTLGRSGAAFDAIYVCPHAWDANCGCRKPKPGMLFQAQRDFDLDLSRTPFVGDDERDVEAGRAAGCPTLLVSDARPLSVVVREHLLGDVAVAGQEP
jgi:histidinol-phosphate phosphatase family protein